MSSFELSEYQKAILNYIRNEKGNLLVDAKAGSGKTSTLLLIADEIISQNKKCLFLAFNKSITEELNEKINNENCVIKTVHALGLSYIRSYLYRKHNKDYILETNSSKNNNIVNHYFEEYCKEDFIKANLELCKDDFDDLLYNVKRELGDLVDFCRFYNINYRDERAVIKMLDWCFTLKDYKEIGMLNFQVVVEKTIDKIKELFEHPQMKNGLPYYEIDFTDMIYFPVYYRMNTPFSLRQSLDYVMVDESQDLSILSQNFIKLVNNGNTRYIFVGDRNQAIYGFAGADTRSIDNIKQNFILKELPLNTCYRCPEKVVRVAKTIVPSIEWNLAREDTGNVQFIDYDEFYTLLKPKDIILGRKNNDLIKIYRNLVLDKKVSVKFKNKQLVDKLIREMTKIIKDYIVLYNKNLNIQKDLYKYLYMNNIPTNEKDRSATQQALVEQRIKDLIKVAEQNGKPINKDNFTLDYLKICMKEYKEKGAYEYEPSIPLTEYYELIISFIEEFEKQNNTALMKNFINYLKEFLSGGLYDDVPVISSVHMMKGGEADNIFIYDYPRFPYKYKGQTSEAAQQEVNLQYVAITRAKKNLYLCLTDDPPAENKEDDLNLKAQDIVNKALAKQY